MTEVPTTKENKIRRWFAARLETRIDRLWLAAILLCASPVHAQDELPDIVTDERTGVRIVFYDFSKHENDMKSRWRNGVVEVVPAKRKNRRYYKRYAKRALKQYPLELIKKYLRTLYIVEEIKLIFGSLSIEPEGTYDSERGAIYLTTGGVRYDSQLNTEDIFHHEFSSFLLHGYAHLFPKAEWLALNPSDFQYKSNVTGSGKPPFVPEEPEFYFQRCVPGPHAASSWENDINTFAMQLFRARATPMGWRELPLPIDEYPCLQKKLDLLAAFYRRIHPMFTAEYFAL